MRRISLLISAAPVLFACDGSGPAKPSSARVENVSAEVGNDSIPRPDVPAPGTEAADGGIMMGSGT